MALVAILSILWLFVPDSSKGVPVDEERGVLMPSTDACLSTNVKSWALPTAACRIRKVADIAPVTALPPSPLRCRE
jgi:hypothetical protein